MDFLLNTATLTRRVERLSVGFSWQRLQRLGLRALAIEKNQASPP